VHPGDDASDATEVTAEPAPSEGNKRTSWADMMSEDEEEAPKDESSSDDDDSKSEE
jgi:hypothetical protein